MRREQTAVEGHFWPSPSGAKGRRTPFLWSTLKFLFLGGVKTHADRPDRQPNTGACAWPAPFANAGNLSPGSGASSSARVDLFGLQVSDLADVGPWDRLMRVNPGDPPGGVSTRRYYIPADYLVTRRRSKKSSRPIAWLYSRFLILTQVVASGV
jgi:hypothetical protein